MLEKNVAKNTVAAPDTELHDKNARSAVVPTGQGGLLI